MNPPRRRPWPQRDYPSARRQARPGDRWQVVHTLQGTWAAGPKQNDTAAVYVDRACTRRWVEFPTWARALEFALHQSGAAS